MDLRIGPLSVLILEVLVVREKVFGPRARAQLDYSGLIVGEPWLN